METWDEMSARHARIEENFQEARYRDWEVLRDRFGGNENIPAHESQAFEQHFGQSRHTQIIRERQSEAQRHPERPNDSEQERNTGRPATRSQEAAPTGSLQQGRPTVYQRPINIEQHYAEQKAYQAQSLADTNQLWNERLERQETAEVQQKASRDQILNANMNPSVNSEKTAEHRRQQERELSPATKSDYVQYQRGQATNDPTHDLNGELNPKPDLKQAAELRQDEDRKIRMQVERDKLKRQEERRQEKKHDRDKDRDR